MDNNVLEFFVKMKDMMSGGLVKLAQTAQNTYTKMQGSIKSTERASDFLKYSINELKNKLEETNKVRFGTVLKSEFKEASREAKGLERQIASLRGGRSGRGLGGMFGGGLLSMVKSLLPVVGLAAIGSFGMSSVQAANAFGAQKQTYSTLTRSSGIGGQLANDLRGLKENTIMGPAVYQNAQTMLGFGVSASEVTKDLRMLGDISMGDANKLQHLTLAFSEVTASGRLTGKEVRQFVNAGFNPLKEISDMTGKSMEVLRKEMKHGAISTEMVAKAFEHATGPGGRFHNMLDKMAETSAGKTQMLEGRVASLKIALGERLQPTYMATVDAMTKLVTWTKHLVEIPAEQKIQEQINKIRGLQIEMTSANTSHARQLEIYKELADINPNIVKGIDEQNIAYGKLAANIDRVVNGLENEKMAEIINRQNADFLDSMVTYKKKIEEDKNNIMANMGAIGDKRLLDPAMSLGQKEILAQKILQDRVKAEGNNFSLTATPNAVLLNKLKGDISDFNRSQEFLGFNAGKSKDIDEKIANARKIYEQVGGIKAMSAAQIQNGGKKTGGTSSAEDSGKDVSKGITSGGPRVINIHGVKFTDKIEIHNNSVEGGVHDMEKQLENMFMRILTSGASVQ